MKPDIEARSGEVVAYFPGGIDAAFLSVDDARSWGRALLVASDAAAYLAEYSKDSR